MNISSKPAHSQFIWSKKEPARIKGSQKLFVTVCKKKKKKKPKYKINVKTNNKNNQYK